MKMKSRRDRAPGVRRRCVARGAGAGAARTFGMMDSAVSVVSIESRNWTVKCSRSIVSVPGGSFMTIAVHMARLYCPRCSIGRSSIKKLYNPCVFPPHAACSSCAHSHNYYA
jgi:ribosomal protein S27AE